MKSMNDCTTSNKLVCSNAIETDSKSPVMPAVIRDYRKARRESQTRFWGRFGVSQSRGSRFELGREIPAPVVILLRLYWEGVVSDGDLWRAKRRTTLKRASTHVNRERLDPSAPPSPPPLAVN